MINANLLASTYGYNNLNPVINPVVNPLLVGSRLPYLGGSYVGTGALLGSKLV